jgi:hypothetical protein
LVTLTGKPIPFVLASPNLAIASVRLFGQNLGNYEKVNLQKLSLDEEKPHDKRLHRSEMCNLSCRAATG